MMGRRTQHAAASFLLLTILTRPQQGTLTFADAFVFPQQQPLQQRKQDVPHDQDSRLYSSSYASQYSQYGTVDSAGPTLRSTPYGQRWEGERPTLDDRFAQSRIEQDERRMQQEQQQSPPPGVPPPRASAQRDFMGNNNGNINNNMNGYGYGQRYGDQIRDRPGPPVMDRDPNPSFPTERGAAPLTRYREERPMPPPPPPPPVSPQRQDIPPPVAPEGDRPFFTSQSYQDRSYRDLDPSPRISPNRHLTQPPPIEMPANAKEIQGGSRGTWSADHQYGHDEVQVTLGTDGRPLKADVEVYSGPSNVPQKMRIYSEDGRRRPFTTLIATPEGASKTHSLLKDWESPMAQVVGPGGTTSHSISIKNTGPMEFPIVAGVEGRGTVPDEERAASMADYSGRSMASFLNRRIEIQGGGALKTYPFDPTVGSVEVRIESQGLPIMAVVELWQGPGDVKTVAQVYCDNGQTKPFSAIIQTPGAGTNTIAIRNVGPTAYPIDTKVNVYHVDDGAYSYAYGNNGF